MLISNAGEPIKLTDINLSGVAASAGRAGETIKVWTKLQLTSDDPLFHRIVPELSGVLVGRASAAGAHVRLSAADMVLVVIHSDKTADLWVDTAAVSINALMRRGFDAGSPVFESDIVDIIALSFPRVQFEPTDGVICLMKVDWRFALFFDFNPAEKFQLETMERQLGSLHRTLRYKHLYDAIADEVFLGRLFEAGWFPFAEILQNSKRSQHIASRILTFQMWRQRYCAPLIRLE